MIVVTGGAGFIGSNLIRALNQRGERNILLVDHLVNGRKMHNIADLDVADYMDKEEFIEKIGVAHFFDGVRAVFHQGACSATTEWDGKYVMMNNYDYSKRLLHWCIAKNVAFMYASSASVYGTGEHGFRVDRSCEHPINMYAYSKFQFDQYVRPLLTKTKSPIVGFRYFNVYGPREQHKGSMSSTAFHFNRQVIEQKRAKLFEGCDGMANGEQKRDFVHVDDVVDVNLWFLDHPEQRGIYNVGTGRAETFNVVAQAVTDWHKEGEIEYIPFPEHLKGAYQSYTQADISGLREAGYTKDFLTVKQGVARYLDWLNA
ncbi:MULTISPECIES: ADP-glyceromanno-heptose 6-epimerase [Methylobacter]|jgi:ADP-L-glycero-D-manno-heptose 6-epimerase|uniref:ADP-L-glycero-D-manno-heptose-6-epimerase n=1 Tax=Methylobacter tundripaludum (strain ATCC BAA-1195 / DSM 17260 / SV96) TaxID=697282 RepID=G3IW79_METTV|nr:ADP-glyceromanno-heptose 6-epimerase [Methylobacter tundripaludum]EGW23014.1 ADP-L-glycero-D-manno-heptose-6-epimerase [Methylobacter tundripaludum SV96]